MKKQAISNPLPALLLLSVLAFGIAGYYFETGLPPLIMMLIGAVTGLLLGLLTYGVVLLGAKLVNRVPPGVNVSILSTLLVLMILRNTALRWPDQLYYPVAVIGILLTVLCYYSIRKLRANPKSWPAWSALLLTGAALIGGLLWLRWEGEEPYLADLPPPFAGADALTLSEQGLPNPAAAGAYTVQTFTYGSGMDKQRPEFAAGVTYQTPTVDATRLLPAWKGSTKKWRESYWGFGVGDFPLNGRVYFPEGEGPFPLVLMVHGNHGMIDHSDGGYAYLGELLASRGIIAVSVDENFINGHWSGGFRGEEMPVRAWLLLKHLEQWRVWNADPEHDLLGKVDMANIMLIGHSRGGEAVAIAAAFNELPHYPDDALVPFDFQFSIKGIVAIAPTDYRYDRKIYLKNINYLGLQGSYDVDETSFWAMRAYRRLQFTDGRDWFKAGVYIHRANHGQFNTSWGRADFGGPFQWLLNRGALVPGGDQRAAAKLFISAFAEAVLKDNRQYLPIFKKVSLARDWLPENYYLTHFADSYTQILANFEEDMNVETAGKLGAIEQRYLKIWREEELKTRDGGSQENKVAVIGWDYGDSIATDSVAYFELRLRDTLPFRIDTAGSLHIALAAMDHRILDKDKSEREKRSDPVLDLTVALEDAQGRRAAIQVSAVKRIAPRLKSRFMKLASLGKALGDEWEVQPETFHLPLQEFELQDGRMDYSTLKRIILRLDQVPYGLLAIDDIGLDMLPGG